jgi:hypothetical protein
MPSGRDSFRRNRVAPFVLFYFTTLGSIGFGLCATSRFEGAAIVAHLRFGY